MNVLLIIKIIKSFVFFIDGISVIFINIVKGVILLRCLLISWYKIFKEEFVFFLKLLLK